MVQRDKERRLFAKSGELGIIKLAGYNNKNNK